MKNQIAYTEHRTLLPGSCASRADESPLGVSTAECTINSSKKTTVRFVK